MASGTIELEQEVEAWLLALPDELFGHVERYIDLLAAEGVHLDEPVTRQLRGKLRELRFHLGRQQTKITYYIATGRRIVLLTVFVKTRQRARLEVQRGWRAMQASIAEGHTVEDDG
ncbi:MAG: type II toxin-antitoxin system RelE/ParE family toxin [Acidimicrobiales bacterium]